MDDLARKQQELDSRKAQLDREQQEISAERHRRKENELLELQAECRKAKEAVAVAEREMQEAFRTVTRARGETENCARHLRTWESMCPAGEDYPTQAEIKAWQDELSRRSQAAEVAAAAHREAAGEYERSRIRWHAQRDAFDKLRDREESMRGELDPPVSGPRIAMHFGSADTVVTN